jgi:DivIVA domain-containing protein
MNEGASSPLVPPRDARITPEGVAERTFSSVKRGYAEAEVRAFLRMVSDELGALASRERQLTARVAELEERLRRPVAPLSDRDLIDALGEETARVLRSARESALELRGKAEEHARRVVREAQETARELREAAHQVLEIRTREAEDAARNRGKEIVAEARSVRERVLGDLNDRKQSLEAQLAEMRSARRQLAETYQTVERALAQALQHLAEEPTPPGGPGAPTAAAPAAPPAPSDGTPGEPSAPPAAEAAPAPVAPARAEEVGTAPAAGGAGAPAGEAPVTEPSGRAATSEAASTDAEGSAEPPDGGPDVHALFERLRSDAGGPAATAPPAPEASATSPPPTAGEGSVAPEADAGFERHETTGDGEAGFAAVEPEPLDPAQAALTKREAALEEVTELLVRRGKRALQDEQNDVLDGLRRQRGKIDVGRVLPALDDQLARWAHVLQPAVDDAYAAGAATVSPGGSRTAPGALLTELAASVVTPLRDRVTGSLGSLETSTPADTEIVIAQRVGARYREWRGQDLEGVLGDALAVAYARGVYDAAPEGAMLRWIPAEVGKCADADDNALEPTARGGKFPTGQPFPPAHPGCRCLLAIDE